MSVIFKNSSERIMRRGSAFDEQKEEEEEVHQDHTAKESDISLLPASVKTASNHHEEPRVSCETSSVGVESKVVMMIWVERESRHRKC